MIRTLVGDSSHLLRQYKYRHCRFTPLITAFKKYAPCERRIAWNQNDPDLRTANTRNGTLPASSELTNRYTKNPHLLFYCVTW